MSTYFNVKASDSAAISPKAGIVGDVTIGDECTIFAGAEIRGDSSPVVMGARTNVQENAVIHVDYNFPCTIGNDVTIGHGAIVHGCTLDDLVMVGMGAIVMNGAHIGSESLIGAGALVTQGKEFPPRSLLMGSPARLVRTLSDDEVQNLIVNGANHYVETGKAMVDEGVMFNPAPNFNGQI
jgi:carbonic anhydrase/acetyltransferase-like protein (isoleucine patch superfamily)